MANAAINPKSTSFSHFIIAFYNNRKRYNRPKLDLRKIARSQGKAERAKTVLSEGKVVIATLKEEKQFAADQS